MKGFFVLIVHCVIALSNLGESQLFPPQCGFSNAPHRRIVGGKPAAVGAWPWIALLGPRRSPTQVNFKCGGSLVTNRHVISAAHCISGTAPYLVRLGEHSLRNNNDGAIDVPVSRIVVHQSYSKRNHANDIAMLYLARSVNFTPRIHAICLPIRNPMRTENLVGKYPFVAGWGDTQWEGQPSDVLREVQLPVVPSSRCAGSRNVNSVICAGYPQGGKDSCQGDSGGPLMLSQGSTWYLVGIVSDGYKCAEPNHPGAYTRVTHFLPWIQSHLV